MGIKNLSKLVRDSKKKKDNLSGNFANGETFGIDIANILFGGATVAAGVHQFHTFPRQPMESVLTRVQKMTTIFRKYCIKQVWVVDGAPHPMKAHTHEKRWKIPAAALANVKRLMKNRDPKDLAELMKAKKASARPTSECLALCIAWAKDQDDIDVLGACYEADHLLSWLELKGATQATVTLDSDLFALNSKVMIDNLSVVNGTGNCNIWRRPAVLDKLDKFFDFEGKLVQLEPTTDILLYLCTLMDTDYVQTNFGMGTKAAGAFAKRMAANISAIQPVLEAIEKDMNADGYAAKFWMNVHNFKFAPIFVQDIQTSIVYLRPLTKLPCGVGPSTYILSKAEERKFEQEWKGKLTWDPFIHFNLHREHLQDYYSLKSWAKTLAPLALEKKIPSGHSLHDGRDCDMPHGSVVDFNHCCVSHQPEFVLVRWLNWRAFYMPQKNDIKKLHATVERVLKNIAEGNAPAILPNEAMTGNHAYTSFEQIRIPKGHKLAWSPDGIDTFSQLIPDIDEAYILEIFGLRPGVRNRAILRINSGNFDINTLVMSDAQLIDESAVKIVRCKCTPSMKSKVYDVSLVFKKDAHNNWAFYQSASHCDCPNGHWFCSHLLGLMMVMYIFQREKCSVVALKEMLPAPVKSLTGHGLPAYLAYNREKYKEEFKIKKEVKQELGKPESSASESTKIKNKSTNDDDDDEEEESESESESDEEEEEEEEEEEGATGKELNNAVLKNIAKHFPGYTHAVDAEEDEQLEEDADEVQVETGEECFNVCEKLDIYIEQFKVRKKKDATADGREYTIGLIENYIKSIVHGKMTKEEEKEKMWRHEMIYREMLKGEEGGGISQDCSLFSFLFFFHDQREQWLRHNDQWEKLNKFYESSSESGGSADDMDESDEEEEV